MGFFIAFLFASILWSSDTGEALNQIRLYSYWIIIPILAISLKKEWLAHLISAFLLGMLLSEVIAYGIFFEVWGFKGRSPDYPSPFMSHIHYSVFLAVTAIVLLNRLLSKRYTWLAKFPMLLFFLTSTGNLLISTGRTGQLAFFAAIAVAVVIHFRLSIKSLLIFTALTAVLFIGAYKSIPLFEERIDHAIADVNKLQNDDYQSSWGLRAAFWIVTYDIVKEHPLIGAGIGDYSHAAKEALEKNDHNFHDSVIAWVTSTHFHNQYLMILAQGGLMGFALMLWLLIALFRLKIEDKELKELSVLMLSVFLVGSIAEPLWVLQFPIILFVFISGISMAGSKKTA